MPEQKTKPTAQSVDEFIDAVPDPVKRKDAKILLDIFKKITGFPPVLWSHSMIGFGDHHYKYASGHEGDTFLAGFSPRKDKHSIYLCGISFKDPLFEKLGKYKHGVGCLYIKKLEDVDMGILEQLIEKGFKG